MPRPESPMIANDRRQNPAPPVARRASENGTALDGRFIAIRIDCSMPLRPQLVAAKAAVADHALRWIKLHPDDAPRSLRIGGQRNGAVYRECFQVLDAISRGIPKREIRAALWPHLDEDDQRERLRHRIRRGRELIESGYRAPVEQDADVT
jgi:hypothetical protein